MVNLKISKSMNVCFLVPPEIQISNINPNPYVILGKNIILSCHGYGVPEINYQWLKDKKSLLESHSYARLIDNSFDYLSTTLRFIFVFIES
jgi:hypothetical protein